MLLPAGDRGTAGEPIGHPFARREREHVVARLREDSAHTATGDISTESTDRNRMVIDK